MTRTYIRPHSGIQRPKTTLSEHRSELLELSRDMVLNFLKARGVLIGSGYKFVIVISDRETSKHFQEDAPVHHAKLSERHVCNESTFATKR